MSNEAVANRNWFDQGGRAYARFRPEYPPELASFLARLAPDTRMAVDVGCGNGQLTQLLAAHFDGVVGLDPSEEQIANSLPDPRIRYLCAPAERLPLPDHCTSLITAAQAAHWFSLPQFYREVRRVAEPAAVLALISYGVLQLEPDLDGRFQRFYREEVGPYWPPERKWVDSGYADMDFPFDALPAPALAIRVEWRLTEFLGYLMTWSAFRRAKETGRPGLLLEFAEEIAPLWGDDTKRRKVAWPINMRLGRL